MTTFAVDVFWPTASDPWPEACSDIVYIEVDESESEADLDRVGEIALTQCAPGAQVGAVREWA